MCVRLRTHQGQSVHCAAEGDGECVTEGDGSGVGLEQWAGGAVQQPRRGKGLHIVVVGYMFICTRQARTTDKYGKHIISININQ
jgi:hypothetical protein